MEEDPQSFDAAEGCRQHRTMTPNVSRATVVGTAKIRDRS